MLQTEFFLTPISAFSNAQNLEYLQIHTPISSTMDCATLAAGLWKATLDKQNSDLNNGVYKRKSFQFSFFIFFIIILGVSFY